MKKEAQDIFQKHFSNHETDVDTDMIWKAIQAKRQQKRRKPFWIFCVSGFILILSVLGISFYSFSTITEKNNVTVELKSKANQTDISSRFYKKESDDNSAQKTSTDKNEPNPSQNKELIPAIKTKNSQSPIFNNITFKAAPVKRVKRTSEGNIYNNSYFPNNNFTFDNANNFSEKDVSVSTAENSHSALDTEFKRGYIKGNKAINIERLSILNSLIQSISKTEFDHLLPEMTSIKVKPNFNHKWSFSVLSGIGKSSSSYTQVVGENISLVESLQTYITPHVNKQITTLVKFQISDRFSVATGLSYQKITEEFNWNKSYIEDLDGNFVRILEDPEVGPFMSLVGSNSSAYSFVKIDRNIFDYNEFELIDLPLRLYYQLSKSSLGVSCFAGLNYNIWQSIDGYTVGNDNQLLNYEETDFTFSVSNQYVLGIEMSFLVHPKLRLVTEVSGRTRQIIEQRYSKKNLSYQFSFGLQMNLH